MAERVTEVVAAPDQGNPTFARHGDEVTKKVPYARYLIPPGVTMGVTIDFNGVVARKKSWTAHADAGKNAMGEVRFKVRPDCGVSDFEKPEPEEL